MSTKIVQVKDKILKYVVGTKVNQVISFMLSHYSEDLTKEVLDMIKEEIRRLIAQKLGRMLEGLDGHGNSSGDKSLDSLTSSNRRGSSVEGINCWHEVFHGNLESKSGLNDTHKTTIASFFSKAQALFDQAVHNSNMKV